MRKRSGLTLVEIALVLALVGFCYVGGKIAYLKYQKTRAAAPPPDYGSLVEFSPSPWPANYPDAASLVRTNAASLATWQKLDEAAKAKLRSDIAAKMGITATTWDILCDRISYTQTDQQKTKCTPAGGLVAVVYSSSPMPQQVGDWYPGLAKGSQIIFLDKSERTHHFKESFDSLVVGKWRRSPSHPDELVFQFLRKASPHPEYRLFVGAKEWKTRVTWLPCRIALPGGLFKKTGGNCVSGLASEPDGNTFVIHYQYFKEWYGATGHRQTLGSEPIVNLAPLEPQRLLASPAAQQQMVASQQQMLTTKCNSTEATSARACYELGRIAEQGKDRLTMFRMAERACDKGFGYSCNWRAELASQDKNTSDVGFYCRRALDLKYFSAGVCSSHRKK